MISAYTQRDLGSEDHKLETFQKTRLDLIEREAHRAGFVTRRVPDAGDTEYLEIFTAAERGTPPGEATDFAMLCARLRGARLGSLRLEIDSREEANWLHEQGFSTDGIAPEVEIRGEGFASDLSEEERRKIDAMRSEAPVPRRLS